VIFGVPDALSLYRKLAVLEPFGIVTVVMIALVVAFTKCPVAELVASCTMSEPDVVAEPLVDRRWIVIVPDVAFGAGVRCGVVNASFGMSLTVSVCVAELNPLADTVIFGDPTALSR
jgi:hypothetical protein